MLKNNHGVTTILRAFSSTLSLDYVAAEAIKIGTPNVLDKTAARSSRRSEKSTLTPKATISDSLSRLESLYAVSDVQYKGRRKDIFPTNKLRADLRKRQHVKFVIDMMIQDYLKKDFIARVFQDNEITKLEFSVFINRLLLEGNLETKLSNIVPDTLHTELLFRLFHIYCEYAVERPEGKLTLSELHDINLFVKTFTDEAQLGKAQRCLQYILDRQGLNYTLQSGDVPTIVNYLRLRCGAIVKFWEAKQNKKMVGQNSSLFKHPNAFKSWNNEEVSYVISTLLKDKSWLGKHSAALDSAIICSLSNMGQEGLIEQYISLKWGVAQDGFSDVGSIVAPDSGTLVAILSSFCLKKNNIAKGLALIDQLIKKYPDIKLEKLFWRRLLQLSFQAWDKQNDRKGQVCHASWNIMKHWHEEKGLNIAYDHGTLSLLHQLFKASNNGRESMEVISRCFRSLYARQSYQILPSEMTLLHKFQKLVVKTMALKGNYHKPLQFIKEWHVDETNQQQLLEYFKQQREKYNLRQKKINAKRDQLQTQYDAMEEEDMLLGRLW